MELGFESTEVGMQCSFGKGDDFWSNTFPSETIDKYVLRGPTFASILTLSSQVQGRYRQVWKGPQHNQSVGAILRFDVRTSNAFAFPFQERIWRSHRLPPRRPLLWNR